MRIFACVCIAISIHVFGLSQFTNIPDPNFEQWLIDLAYKAPPIEGRVETRLIRNIQSVTIAGRGVKDLTGIEDFAGMTTFSANGSSFNTIVDLSSNKNLASFSCSNCNLTTLDLRSNTNINQITVDDNRLSSLLIPDSSNIDLLSCRNNQLTELDISTATNLSTLYCDSNHLQKIDLVSKRRMRRFSATNNKLNEVKLPVVFGGVGLTNFDLKNNPDLTCIEVGDSTSFRFYSIYRSSKDTLATYELKCEKEEKPSGINKHKHSSLKLFPNPTSGRIQIVSPVRNFQVRIYNLAGRELIQQIEIEGYAGEVVLNTKQGMYFVRITNEKLGFQSVEPLFVQ